MIYSWYAVAETTAEWRVVSVSSLVAAAATGIDLFTLVVGAKLMVVVVVVVQRVCNGVVGGKWKAGSPVAEKLHLIAF